MKNLLVIGSRGFIGKACVTYFSRKYKVTGCDIHPADGDAAYSRITSPGDFAAVIASSDFEACINASGSANVAFSFEHPEKDHELNVDNVDRMLEALAVSSPQCRFINFSSAAVYGNPERLPVNEDAATHPLSPYGKNKMESERVLRKYATERGLHTCSLRVFSAYGPALHKQLFWDIYRKSRSSQQVKLYGTGSESRDFIYIHDVLQAVECVLSRAAFGGEVYNVASGIETTVKDAAALFLSFLGEGHSLAFSGEEKSGDPVNWRADISRLCALGFRPQVTLEEGLRATAEAYRSVVVQ